MLDAPLRVSDLIGLGWSISDKFPSDVDAAGGKTILYNHWCNIRVQKIIIKKNLEDHFCLIKALLLTIYKVLLSLAGELEESLLEATGISPRLQDKAEQSEQRADRLRNVVGGKGLPWFGSPSLCPSTRKFKLGIALG